MRLPIVGMADRDSESVKASNRRNPLWQNSWSLKTKLGSHWPPG